MDDILMKIAKSLRLALRESRPIEPIRAYIGAENIDAAYRIQSINNEIRQNNGGVRVGHKIGLTSVAVQQQIGVDQPDFGVLFKDMWYRSDNEINADSLIAPKVEGEYAFVLARDIREVPESISDLSSCVEYVLPAIEIVDSRIRAWDLSIVDTIADNASSAFFVTGQSGIPPGTIDLVNSSMQLFINDEPVVEGCGKNCMGHPLEALRWLAGTMIARNEPLLKGQVILSGALAKFVDVRKGDTVRLEIAGLEDTTISFN